MSEQPALYLVDGTYLLFRAFHSLPSTMAVTGETYRRSREALANLLREGAGTAREPEGIADVALTWLSDPAHDRIPTNAVRGLTTVLMKLVREAKPAYIGVAFDLPGRVHRDEHYESFVERHPAYAPKLAGYKATRPETPIELNAQMPLARIVTRRALGIPILEAERYEADDLIGTLARRGRDRGFAVRLVTADKDLFQLVEEGISILNPHKPDPKGPSGYLLMDAKIVEREFGVPPGQVVDVLALMGDASDNIPGVPGIGEKGARELVAKFGTVEGCLAAAKEEGKIARNAYRKGLLDHEPLALLSKELATIHDDAPVGLGLDDLRAAPPDPDAMRRVFTLLAFESFLRDAPAAAGARTGAGTQIGAAPLREQEEIAGRPGVQGQGRGAPEAGRGGRAPKTRGAVRDEGPSLLGFEHAGGGDGSSGDPVDGGPVVLMTPDPADAERYRVVLDTKELEKLVPSILAARRVAVDTETTSDNPRRAELVGISIAWEPERAIYIPIGHRYLGSPAQPSKDSVLKILAPLLEDPARPKTGQNVKYDIEVLRRAGSETAGFSFDTMIAAFLLEPDRPAFGLGGLVKEYLGDFKMSFADVAGKGAKQVTFDQVGVELAAVYSGRDADVTLRLAEALAPRLAAEGLDRVFDGIDMPLIEVLVAMETAGVRIDVPLLERLSKEMREQLAGLRAQIHALAGHEFNVESPQQLARVLFDEIGLKPVSKTAKSGAPSTRDEDLEELAAHHPLPACVREYRSIAKLRSTYVDALPTMVDPGTGRVHTSFNPTGAATGRLSSSDPNLQNIPVRTPEGRKIRAAFVPEPGWKLISADYSQIELRVLAHLSRDPDLITAFKRGEDIHRSTAAKIFGTSYEQVNADQRRAAKTINFGILYGMGPVRLARDLAIPQTEAKTLIEQYFGRFPGIRAYIDGTVAKAEKDGFVSTLFGRIRRFPELASTSRNARQMAVRAAVNSTIQGTAADIMKLAMVRLHRDLKRRGLASRILIQVHDELVLEGPPDEMRTLEPAIREAMEGAASFEVPLTVEVASGENWLDAKA